MRREPSKKRAPKLPERELLPLNPIVCIRATEVATLPREAIHSDEVGWKAYGLSSMPAEWVPKYLVIQADCFGKQNLRRDYPRY